MNPYCIVLADDYDLLRQGIKKLIETSRDIRVVGEASDGVELLDLLKKITPHMIVLDISMPNLSGLGATRKIKTIYPEVKILILSIHKGREYLCHAFASGAEGYLLKEDTDTELFSAIEAVRQGGIYMSPSFSKELANDIFETYSRKSGEPSTIPEKEILALIAEGKSRKQIAAILSISEGTVEHHRSSIMKKLNLKKIADLVTYIVCKEHLHIDT